MIELFKLIYKNKPPFKKSAIHWFLAKLSAK